jgi:hypothetical protein
MATLPEREYRSPQTAKRLKAMGVLPGVADLEFHWLEVDTSPTQERVTQTRRVLHLELKVRNRKPSQSQEEYALAVLLLGDDYYIVQSIDEAMTILGEHGLIKEGIKVAGVMW